MLTAALMVRHLKDVVLGTIVCEVYKKIIFVSRVKFKKLWMC